MKTLLRTPLNQMTLWLSETKVELEGNAICKSVKDQ